MRLMNRSANLRRQIGELKDELGDVRSELAEVSYLIALTRVTQFPAGMFPAGIPNGVEDVAEEVVPEEVKKRA